MRSESSGLMTGPVLATVSWLRPAVVRVLIQMSPAAMLYRMALSTRFAMRRSASPGSPEMTAGSSVAGGAGGPRGGGAPPVAQAGGVEDVFGGRGQVDLLVNGEPALVAREDEQRGDDVLGVIDRGADVGRHGAQVAGCAVRVAQHDVDGGAHDGERGAQFMGGVSDEPLLALERGLEPAEHLVKRLGQFAEFVAGPGRRDPRRQVVFGRGAGGRGDLVHRAQRPPGKDPAEDRGQGDDHGQRDQRVLQQIRQGQVTLALRALKLKVRGALSKYVRIGAYAPFRGPAP